MLGFWPPVGLPSAPLRDVLLNRAAQTGQKVAFPMNNGWYLYSFFRGAGLEMQLSEDGVTNTCNWNATDTAITGVQVLSSLLEIARHPGFISADSDTFVTGIKDGPICVNAPEIRRSAW